MEEEAKDIEKAIKEEREERVVALKENEKKREERRAVVEAEIERLSRGVDHLRAAWTGRVSPASKRRKGKRGKGNQPKKGR